MIKLVIFDLDGTLLNTIEDLANSTNFALRQHDFPMHPVEAYNFFVGNGIAKLIERALPGNSRTQETISVVKRTFLKHYSENTEVYTKPYPGIVELLVKIQQEGYKIAIASNKFHAGTSKLAKYFFPDIEFAAVLGQRENFPTKPDPSIVEEILAKTKTPKANVLYVGDSGVDVMTAHNADVSFVGVLWGFRPRNELEALGAKIFVQNTQELYDLIKSGEL
ncbi:MAG: HAD family hydrolase [Paludibacter sp.]|nr:HAD family hydrolase [Paludibacter sp.]